MQTLIRLVMKISTLKSVDCVRINSHSSAEECVAVDKIARVAQDVAALRTKEDVVASSPVVEAEMSLLAPVEAPRLHEEEHPLANR